MQSQHLNINSSLLMNMDSQERLFRYFNQAEVSSISDSSDCPKLLIKTKRFPDCVLTIKQEKQLCQDYFENIKHLNNRRSSELQEKYGISQGTFMRIMRAYNIPTSKKIYNCDEHFFDEINTEAKAYFLGLLTADGYIVNRNNGLKRRYVVQLSVTDKELPEMFRIAIKGNQKIYDVDMSKWNGNPVFMIVIGSKIMVESLYKLGVKQKKSKTQTFCQEVPKHLINNYIRGIFDGDGMIGYYPKDKHYLFSISGTQELLLEIQKQLINIGCYKTKLGYSTGRYILQYGGRKQVLKIKNYLYGNSTIYLKRKFNKFPTGLSLQKCNQASMWEDIIIGVRK